MYGDDNYSGFGKEEQTTTAYGAVQGGEQPTANTYGAAQGGSEPTTTTYGAAQGGSEPAATTYGAAQGSTQSAAGVFSGGQGGDSTVTPYFNRVKEERAAQNTADGSTSQQTKYSTYQMGTPEAQPEDASPKKEKRKGGFWRKAVMAVSMGSLFGLCAGVGFYVVQQATGFFDGKDTQTANVQNVPVLEETQTGIRLNNTSNVTVVNSDISDVVEEVMPAMVSIVNNYTESTQFWGQTYTQQAASSGSGIIVAENDSELLIVSNNHVVVDADQLTVTFQDGTEAEAKIKGLDSDMDLAVIAVALEDLSAETKSAIAVAALGDSDNLKLGEPVIAIGNALGYGQSVTTGIVSALNREVTMEDGSVGTFIQTDAAINPGNSGGALLNMKGEIIGINSNKIGGTAIEGMGYAIPITSASPIIADLMERQTRNKVNEKDMGYIGISMQEVTEQIAATFSMPTGIYVLEVQEGSAAQKAGMMKGDIVTKFDGTKISAFEDLQNALQYYAAGDTATITVMRQENGQYMQYDLQITLGKKPQTSK